MQISAEARLWWMNKDCSSVEQWFERMGDRATGGTPTRDEGLPDHRIDEYVRDPDQAELGVKLRSVGTSNPRLEVKTLVAVRGEAAPFGPVTIWTKTSSAALTLQGTPTIRTTKRRRLRKFAWNGAVLSECALDEHELVGSGEQPESGCDVEFTGVTVEGRKDVWWTLGYEAFGKLDEVERILRSCLLYTVSRSPLGEIESAEARSYPEWLISLDPGG